MRREKAIFGQPQGATSAQPHGGHVGHTGAESPSGCGAHGSPMAWATRGLLATYALARSLTFFSRILGIRTPISNLFLDYKP